ncbi:hypothetical protein M422DRAFT_261801 [Sphaerobolus stellatus SS14]|uniref:Uncharacterized protein n=1 Tax=Sphaerobolus stellatus (strain SS14) TaxID=990650 RepID=A0A0C9VE71_SPHS4|nr:hypothetical protein M422DRAFT_261801 [Sphaerobolus stellatus SS14]
MYVFTRDEILSGINEAWPHISEYIQQMDESCTTFERELYEETAYKHRLHDENEDLRAQIIKLETRIESLQPTSLSEHILAPTPTTESPTGSPALTTPVKASYSQKRSCKLDKNKDFRNKVRKYNSRPDHWSLYMEDSDGYFLEQDVDVAAWLTKVIGELPRQAVMLRMKDVFGSCTNFDMACIGFDPNLFRVEMHRSQWLMDASLPLRIGSQITKGIKSKTQIKTAKILEGPEFLKLVLEHCSLSREQIYHQIIPYMIRDDEKRPLSSAAVELAAYMALREQEKAPYKGKKPATANRQSKPSVHAPTPAKTGESSRQRLDADLESYGQAHEQVLPYDEAPPSSEPDAGETAPPSGGANSTLYDESTMDIDQIVGDIYRDC